MHCNQPKPLSGIETAFFAGKETRIAIAINLNPYQGLKPSEAAIEVLSEDIAINLNPYQGLKLIFVGLLGSRGNCNQPKPLSGIETLRVRLLNRSNMIAINLNPYQGLKPTGWRSNDRL